MLQSIDMFDQAVLEMSVCIYGTLWMRANIVHNPEASSYG